MSTSLEVRIQPTKPDGMRAHRRLSTDLLIVAGFCAFLFFFGLGAFGFVGADEPRYAQIAREMLARHDWIVPVLNGQPWLEKPVLYYWEAMLSYGVFGVTDWAARVPAACSATAFVLAIYFFMRRFRPGTELDAALIAASSAGVVGYARAASTDMPLTAALTIGMLSWAAWNRTGRKLWLAGFYVLVGCGMLAKGPIAPFLAAAIVVAYAALRRDPRIVLRTLWWPGVLAFCAVVLPWYLAVQTRVPSFFRTFFFEHNIERFRTNEFHHPAPIWYYLVVLALAVTPWTVFAIRSYVEAVRHAGARDEEHDLNLLLMVWVAVPTIFFSFSVSKLPGYILPAVPPFALLLATCLRRNSGTEVPAGHSSVPGTPRLWLVLLHSALGAALLGAALVSQYFVLRIKVRGAAVAIATVAAALVFVAMVATLRLQGTKALRFVTLVPVILALGFILRIGAPVLDARLSARPLARQITRLDPQNSPVAVLLVRREVEYGLNFYLDRPIPRYDRDPAPVQDHLLVTRTGDELAASVRLRGRRLSHVGSFASQGLEIYWVSTPPPMVHAGHESGSGHPATPPPAVRGDMGAGKHHQH